MKWCLGEYLYIFQTTTKAVSPKCCPLTNLVPSWQLNKSTLIIKEFMPRLVEPGEVNFLLTLLIFSASMVLVQKTASMENSRRKSCAVFLTNMLWMYWHIQHTRTCFSYSQEFREKGCMVRVLGCKWRATRSARIRSASAARIYINSMIRRESAAEAPGIGCASGGARHWPAPRGRR